MRLTLTVVDPLGGASADVVIDADPESSVGDIAREGGQLALAKFRTEVEKWEKSPGNFVCEVDLAVNELLHERLSALDLRCLVGMTAHVIGQDEVRTIRVAELCQEAGCKSCFVSVHDPLNHEAISGFFYTEEVPPWQEF